MVALFGSAIPIGYLARHEIITAFVFLGEELEELRNAMAIQGLLYESSDSLSATFNYQNPRCFAAGRR